MRKVFIVFLLLFVSIKADDLSSNSNTYFNFINIFYDGKSSALGKYSNANYGDYTNFLNNPALLINAENSIVSNFSKILSDIYVGQISYLGKIKEYKYSTSIGYLNYGSIEGRDVNGEPTGDLSASDMMVNFSISHSLNRFLDFGLGVNFLYSSIDNSSCSGLGFNFGVIYRSSTKGNFAFSVTNVGFTLSKITENDEAKLPSKFIVGWSKELAHLPVITSLSLSKKVEDDYFIHGGLIFKFMPSFFVRLGYFASLEDDISFVASEATNKHGLTFGFNLMNIKKFDFDFSYVPFAHIGTISTFSLKYKF